MTRLPQKEEGQDLTEYALPRRLDRHRGRRSRHHIRAKPLARGLPACPAKIKLT